MEPIKINGKYSAINIYCDPQSLTQELISQAINLCNQPFTKESHIALIPDTHVGKGCMIGTTMTITDEICPNLVGVDIGCGMFVVNLGDIDINFERFDNIITDHVPLGTNIHNDEQKNAINFLKENPLKAPLKRESYIYKSLGTLGGGNHFIELAKDDTTNNTYLVIHSGSRYLGHYIANYWQNKAIETRHNLDLIDINQLIKSLKEQGRHKEIEAECIKAREKNNKQKISFNKDLATLKGVDKDNYLHDMKITQKFACLNREHMANIILKHYNHTSIKDYEHYHTIHNYIDRDTMMLRKGAISAQKGEKVIIPLNMRDGSLIAIGKGNPDWNYSAPHGAGRLLSRSKAKQQLNMNDYKHTMKGIYSSSINEHTLDEAPDTYKNPEMIKDYIKDTCDIIAQIKPIYNRKASN